MTGVTTKCKCGHSMVFVGDKKICSWCGCYCFKNEKIEFKYRILEKEEEAKIGDE